LKIRSVFLAPEAVLTNKSDFYRITGACDDTQFNLLVTVQFVHLFYALS